jgi:hypothetical protein
MPSDRELIVLCAEKVMGLHPECVTDGFHYRVSENCHAFIWDSESPYIEKIEGWNPLESDADAFMLVDAMAERCCDFTLERVGDQWFASFGGFKGACIVPGVGGGESRRRAIVLACLRAVGVEVANAE